MSKGRVKPHIIAQSHFFVDRQLRAGADLDAYWPQVVCLSKRLTRSPRQAAFASAVHALPTAPATSGLLGRRWSAVWKVRPWQPQPGLVRSPLRAGPNLHDGCTRHSAQVASLLAGALVSLRLWECASEHLSNQIPISNSLMIRRSAGSAASCGQAWSLPFWPAPQ